MASMQEIQSRIDSVKVTKQIAQAMQLVSNTKIRRCRDMLEGSRPFLKETLALLDAVSRTSAGRGRPFVQEPGKALYIVVGSDRGLCGGYNVNVCRHAHNMIRKEAEGAVIFALGSRVHDYFIRRGVEIEQSFRGISQSPFYLDGKKVATLALELFQQREVTKIVLVYTVFETMLSHKPFGMQLLPLQFSPPTGPTVTLEPDEEEIVDALLPDYLSGCVFGALAEGSMCEQSSRVTSMDAAVNNCGDLIEEMQLEYNQARQGAITQELNEIISGAGAKQN